MGRPKASPKAKPKAKTPAKKVSKAKPNGKSRKKQPPRKSKSGKKEIKSKPKGRKRAVTRASRKSKKAVKMEIYEGGFPDFMWSHVFKHMECKDICRLRRVNKYANAVAHSADMSRLLSLRMGYHQPDSTSALLYQKNMLERWQNQLDPHVVVFSQQRQITSMAEEINQLYDYEIEDCEYRDEHFDAGEWSEPEEERTHIQDDLLQARESKRKNESILNLSQKVIVPSDIEKKLLVALKHLVTCNMAFQHGGLAEDLQFHTNIPDEHRAEWRELFIPKLTRFLQAAHACKDFMDAKHQAYNRIQWFNGIYIRHVSDGITKAIPPNELGPSILPYYIY